MSHRFAGGLLAAVALATLVSCSESTSGGPALPSPSSDAKQSSSAATTSGSDVPPIANPIQAPGLADNPCQALSGDQAQQLGLSQGNPETDSSGPVCIWEYADVSVNQVVIGVTSKFDGGLADVYARKDALGFFKETTVAGYPGVYVGKYGPPDEGFCQLYVGLNGRLAPMVIGQLGGGTDYGRPCEVAEVAAEAMIENLRG